MDIEAQTGKHTHELMKHCMFPCGLWRECCTLRYETVTNNKNKQSERCSRWGLFLHESASLEKTNKAQASQKVSKWHRHRSHHGDRTSITFNSKTLEDSIGSYRQVARSTFIALVVFLRSHSLWKFSTTCSEHCELRSHKSYIASAPVVA